MVTCAVYYCFWIPRGQPGNHYIQPLEIIAVSGSSPNAHSRKQTALLTAALNSQNPVFLNTHKNSVLLHFRKRPAQVMDTFFASQRCPLKRASTVFPCPSKKVFVSRMPKMCSIYHFFSYLLATPRFTNVSNDKSLREGHNLQLFCDACGRPTPNITWVRITSSGSESEVLHRGTIWDLKNISRTEAGTYRCIAYNGVGNSVNHTVRVYVECECT